MDMKVHNEHQLWWNVLPGPHKFLDEICNRLMNQKHVSLMEANLIPWPLELREEYCNACITSTYTEAIIELLDDKDIANSQMGIGNYLLNTHCHDPRIINSYRPSPNRSIGKYLVDNHVAANKIYWVKDIQPQRASLWEKFLKEFCSSGIYDGLFVIEYPQMPHRHLPDNVAEISYRKYVHDYDYYAFCCQLVLRQDSSMPYGYNRYLSALLYFLCGHDVEMAIKLLSQYPQTLIEKTSRDIFLFTRENGLDNSLDEPTILSRMWKAQVQELFPILENARISLIELYRRDLQHIWDCGSYPTIKENRNGDKREGIDDLEIADLRFLMHQWAIRVPEEGERNKIELIYNSRNKLAHHTLCSSEEIKDILKKILI